jgi:hypothetical protein
MPTLINNKDGKTKDENGKEYGVFPSHSINGIVSKIFKSLDLRNNRIITAKVAHLLPKDVNKPEDKTDDANKTLNDYYITNRATLWERTTYNTAKLRDFFNRSKLPTKFPWFLKANNYETTFPQTFTFNTTTDPAGASSYNGIDLKVVLDEILYPKIAYPYTEAELLSISFTPYKLPMIRVIDPKDGVCRYIWYSKAKFDFRTDYNIDIHDRVNPANNTTNYVNLNFYKDTTKLRSLTPNSATGMNNTGNFACDNIFQTNVGLPDGFNKVTLSKQYNACPVKNNNYDLPSNVPGKTDLGIKSEFDVTKQFNDTFLILPQIYIRKRVGIISTNGAEQGPINSTNPLEGFSAINYFQINSGDLATDVIFDVLIHKTFIELKTGTDYEYIYDMVLDRYSANDAGYIYQSSVNTINKPSLLDFHITDTVIPGTELHYGYINFGRLKTTTRFVLNFVPKYYMGKTSTLTV